MFGSALEGYAVDDLLAEAGVPVYLGARLSSVTRSDARITELVTDNGQVFRGLMHVDAGYEGDLMDRAGLGWTLGREANTEYGETINGVQLRDKHQSDRPVDPYVVAASHIAYGSIRMEPVFMILARSAATAAVLAVDAAVPVQQVSYPALEARLRQDGQLLRWPLTGTGEVIVDNAATTGVTRAGTWVRSTATGGFYGPDYEHDGNAAKGVNRLRFTPALPAAGSYAVYLRRTAHENRAGNVPVDLVHSGGTTTRTVDQRVSGGQWVSLGTFTFAAGSAGSVLIRTESTTGYVVADAVRFVPA
jgi:hypothetical protein